MKIFIDPGHGGVDAGAAGPSGVLEKNINLEFARVLAETLTAGGHSVKLARTDDYFLDLAPRAELANEWGADLFVSIHCNTSTPAARGTETFSYPGSSAGAQVAARIQESLTKAWNTVNRGVKTANFAVLRRTTMPSVLIELAFLSNPAEEKLLLHPGMRQKGARAVFEGITGEKPAPTPKMNVEQAKAVIRRHVDSPNLTQWFDYLLARDGGGKLLIRWAKSYSNV